MKEDLEFIPFTFLSSEERKDLRDHLVERTYHYGDEIYAQGDSDDMRLFVLLDGEVEEVFDTGTYSKRINLIEPGHYFGERAVLFEEGRNCSARALGEVRCYTLEGTRFLDLLDDSPIFARALGQILREKQGIFLAFDRFMAELLHGVASGRLDFSALRQRYKDLVPALHPLLNRPEKIDFSALAYACRRLPEHVSRTLVWFMADELPMLYSDPAETFDAIATAGRRRAIYQMMPGKSIILLRDGMSDLIDLISCLCLYAVEARKIRKRIEDPSILLKMTTFLTSHGRKPELNLLKSLPFTDDEVEGLRQLWPGHTVSRLREIALHHEDFKVSIWKRMSSHNSSHADVWTAQIAEATEELMGFKPHALPPDLRVHIISSNTHSVTNCMSTYLVSEAEAIIGWGERVGHPLLNEQWHNRQDKAVALCRDYFTANPAEKAKRSVMDDHEGVLELRATAFTGIRVQLFDTKDLCLRPIDPGLDSPPMQSRALILNIDYAFGQQAEEILSNLIKLFGRNLDSVNVLGKAGGLTGNRGDVLMPTAFVRQSDDRFRPLTQTIDIERLKSGLKGGDLHMGPVLTVAGTLLQNAVMLNFYRHLWRCVGLEMEGSFYHEPMEEARVMSFIPDDMQTRFLYYTSDLPLQAEENLSGSMRAIEGIPPLYAITREILNSIFDQERARLEEAAQH